MHNLRFFAFGAALALCSTGLKAEDLTVGITRHDFAARISKLCEGDSKQRVRELLGPPDDVRTHRDPDEHFIWEEGIELWCYGANGHLTFPTLGLVLVGDDGKVCYIAGNGGEPPKPDLFVEDELRTLLRRIDRLQPDSWNYNPARTIEVVNALQPLGKEKALAAVDEYLRVHSMWNDRAIEGIFLMLRVLFDPPDDPGHWRMDVPAGTSIRPVNPKLIPRFPMILQDDIPLLVYVPGGRFTAGRGLPLEQRMACFRQKGKIRQRPLLPSDHPAAAVEAFIKLPPRLTPGRKWEAHEDAAEHAHNHAVNQLLWLVEPVYRPDRLPEDGDKVGCTETEDHRQKLLSEIAKLDIRWDAAHNRYTFKNGTTLTERD